MDIKIRDILLFSTLRNKNYPFTIFTIRFPDDSLHSFVYTFFGIFIFFYNHFNTIHHFHVIYLHTVY